MELNKICESCYLHRYDIIRIYALTIEDLICLDNRTNEKYIGYTIRIYFDEDKDKEIKDIYIGMISDNITTLYKSFDEICHKLQFNKVSPILCLRQNIRLMSCNIDPYDTEHIGKQYFIISGLSNGKKIIYGKYNSYQEAVNILDETFN